MSLKTLNEWFQVPKYSDYEDRIIDWDGFRDCTEFTLMDETSFNARLALCTMKIVPKESNDS